MFWNFNEGKINFNKVLIVLFLTSKVCSIGTAFLNVPFNPKHLALAGAGTALIGDPSLFRLNPALVVQDISSIEVYFAYNSWLAGTSGHSVLAVQPLLGGSMALGLRSLSISELEQTTIIWRNNGEIVEIFWSS